MSVDDERWVKLTDFSTVRSDLGLDDDPPASSDEPTVVTVEEFAAVDEPGADPLVGDAEGVVFAENGDAMVYGDGGAGKTTLAIDLAMHIAAGDAWLGIPIPESRRVLLIENEGPRPLFRQKLDRKVAGWQGSAPTGRVFVWEEPWGEFTFASETWRAKLAEVIRSHEIDVVMVGPLTAVGMDEAGTLQEVREFDRLRHDVRRRAERHVLFVVIHHENKGGKVSGAWEGVGDTLLHVQPQGHGRTRLYWQKARWASSQHGTSMNLLWAEGESFVVEEEPELTDEMLAELIVAAIAERSGSGWTRIEEATPGVARDRRRAVRDGLFAAKRIINVVKQGGEQAVLDRCPEKVAAHLYVADDPAVAHLRLERGAAAAQPAPTRGEPGDLQLRRAPRPKSGAEAQAQPYPPSTNDEEAQLDTAWWEQS